MDSRRYHKEELSEFPEKERELWRLFSGFTFEKARAATGLTGEEALQRIDHQAYHRLVGQGEPTDLPAVLDRLAAEKLVIQVDKDSFNITNLGAVLFARNLDSFEGLTRKTVRVVIYKGTSRVETIREQAGHRGYAAGFQRLIAFIMQQVPANEQIHEALRREVPVYPEIAVRELVANALVHQDFTVSGVWPNGRSVHRPDRNHEPGRSIDRHSAIH